MSGKLEPPKIDQLRQKIPAVVRAIPGIGKDAQIVSSEFVYTASGWRVTFRVQVADKVQQRSYYFKFYHCDYEGYQSYDTMVKLHRELAKLTDKFMISQPIHYDRDTHCLVTLAFPGGSLLDALKGWRLRHSDALLQWVRRISDWLAVFRQATQTEAWEDSCFKPRALQVLADCEILASKRWISPTTLDAVATVIRKVYQPYLEGHSYPVTGRHGDFVPENISVSDYQIVVHDWDLYDLGSPYTDPTQFLSSLTDLATSPRNSYHAIMLAEKEFLLHVSKWLDKRVLLFHYTEMLLQDAHHRVQLGSSTRPRWFAKLILDKMAQIHCESALRFVLSESM